MPSLKDLRNRINSVKSTRKITSAMKMVAASKLRRAQEQAESGRPYADRMQTILASLTSGIIQEDEKIPKNKELPKLLIGTGEDSTHLILLVTADRGLCGSFNTQIIRYARRQIKELVEQGKKVKLICIGRKGDQLMKRTEGVEIIRPMREINLAKLTFDSAHGITEQILAMFDTGEFDICTVYSNKFYSVIRQEANELRLIPAQIDEVEQSPVKTDDNGAPILIQTIEDDGQNDYEFEPDEGTILNALLPRNLAVQIYRAMIDSAAGEHAARMTAMDNATRNAGDMIKNLTLVYNRTRQAYITKELIEIISGAEAV
jgi:F-type H+-transporting ATPase subunit gamma